MFLITYITTLPDAARLAIMPALKLLSLLLNVPLFEDGSFDL
jgi:hypothetical protein